MSRGMTWSLTDHICKGCGGRILRCVSGSGPTPGGNPVFKCADCGKAQSAMGPAESLCWCSFHHRSQHMQPYVCVAFSVLDDLKKAGKEDQAQKLLSAFRACGCEPGRSEVGIVLERDYVEATR